MPIDNIFCIINGIFHGIFAGYNAIPGDTMRGSLVRTWYFDKEHNEPASNRLPMFKTIFSIAILIRHGLEVV